MKLIPASPHLTGSRAEKRIFDALRSAYCGPKEHDFTVFHSLNLTRHAWKRFGEIDFLIICPLGIYALEVKGGRVSCKEGVWSFTNRYNETNTSVEGPFRQSESALHGLLTKLREVLPPSVVDEFAIGYGVIMPDCRLDCASSEWDQQMLCHDGAHKDIEHWLQALFKYWRHKDRKERRASPESLKVVKQFLRPEFEAVIPLHTRKEAAEEEVKRLTESQMAFVDVIEASKRVICSGGAGTGKTFLAVELARRWTADSLKVLLVCRSPWLCSYLKSKFVISGLTVSSIDGVRMAARRSGVEKFDALIVDEGQDLLNMDSLELLDENIDGGLAEGRWCYFNDTNNQSGMFGPVDEDAIKYLELCNPVPVPLKHNCRNTAIILDKIKASTGADMGTLGAGQGPEISEVEVESITTVAQTLESELHRLVNEGGLSSSEVTILYTEEMRTVLFESLPEKVRRRIIVLDEFSMQNFPPDSVSFSSVWEFKGLENEAIIFVGKKQSPNDDTALAESYVAMSRARSVLSIIYS